MSKVESITRWMVIIQKLRTKAASYDEIIDHLERESEIQHYDLAVSKRTLQRDIHDILTVFGIEIIYDPRMQAYRIDSDQPNDRQQRAFEAFQLYDALKMSEKIHEKVILETRRPMGTEHLYGILHAIENHKELSIQYTKYWEEGEHKRRLRPYALKECKNRWYVLGEDTDKNAIRTFALDRISDITVEPQRFEYPADFDAQTYFEHSFGIIRLDDQKPQKVVLSFTAHQGKYIKSLPLHPSQQILADVEGELRIELYLYITFDLIQEILSHGSEVEVIKPKSLAREIQKISEAVRSFYD